MSRYELRLWLTPDLTLEPFTGRHWLSSRLLTAFSGSGASKLKNSAFGLITCLCILLSLSRSLGSLPALCRIINFMVLEMPYNIQHFYIKKMRPRGFSGGSVVRNPPANAGDMGLIRDPERSHIPWSS